MDSPRNGPAGSRTAAQRWLAGLLLMATTAGPLVAEWKVLADRSLFAVVTHKEGLGARFAHEHLVVAGAVDAELALPSDGERGGSFSLSLAVADLAIDDPSLAALWQDRLLQWGVIAAPFAELSDGDREKIRRSMLADDQLAATGHPRIRARASDLAPAAEAFGPWTLELSLTVRDRTLEQRVEATVERHEHELHARVIAPLRFTDLGIEPYSAMLGAVRVADAMHLVVVLVAAEVDAGAAAPGR